MKNKVAVIIPTFNSARTLGACLDSIKKQSHKNIEIIVVDNNSTDTTIAIARKYTSKIYIQGPERSAQRNYGASKTNADFLLFVDSDMMLSRTVVADSLAKMSETDSQIVVIPELSFGTSFWAQCKALERSFYNGITWMEAARFFTKKIFEEFSGYDENNTGTEDYDLPQRVISKYGSTIQSRIESVILHDEGNLSLLKTLKKKFYYAHNVSTYSSKVENRENYKYQTSILRRYALFFSKPIILFKNPFLGVGMLFMKTAEFLFGGMGFLKNKLASVTTKAKRFITIDVEYLLIPKLFIFKSNLIFKNNVYTLANMFGSKKRSLTIADKEYYFDTPFCLKTFFAASYDFYSVTEKISILKKNNPLIIDIGSNVGQFLFAVKEHKPEAKVVCFEPDPTIYSILKQNSKNYKNVETINCALGEKSGNLSFYRNLDFSEWSSFLEGVNGDNYETITVEVKKPDNILDKYSHIDLIKIDVEGMELSVLKGMSAALKNTEYVLIELSINRNIADSKETFELLLKSGFTPYHYGRIFSAGKFERQGAIDILFKRISNK